MEGHRHGGVVRVEGDARQRYFDSSGYGRPHGSGVDLAPIEAAHLLYRGELDAVEGERFRGYFLSVAESDPGFVARFVAYADLRERGFYLSPAREGWPGDADSTADLTVFERGDRPGGSVAYHVRVVGERDPVAVTDLPGTALAVVDEESEVSYFTCSTASFDGATTFDPPTGLPATLLGDRAVCWDPPAALYGSGFYGQPLSGRDAAVVDALQLSLVEAARLAEIGVIDVTPDAVRDRGRAVEGERFDRRLAVYRTLREQGVVPKTGFKFGADFRTYDEVTSVDELGHSETLVWVVPPDYEIGPRELALDVRLAGGVRKRPVFALADDEVRRAVAVERLTP